MVEVGLKDILGVVPPSIRTMWFAALIGVGATISFAQAGAWAAAPADPSAAGLSGAPASQAQTAPAAKGKATGADAAKQGAKTDAAKPADAKPPAPLPPFFIEEFRVEGADGLAQIDVEAAIYPFLGPRKTMQDVEKARAALEKAYQDRGLQTVSVAVPDQDVKRGFVVLKVTESKVARLRVKGSRYFDLDTIKDGAPSLKEGTLPNLNAVTKDLTSLNRWPDRRVTPALRAGVTPGTIDVDLNVDDTFPLHGSVELNNRKSPNTKPLRLEASLRYDNLWQLGHSLTFTYQVAPQQPSDTQAFSVSYLARTSVEWFSILAYGLKSNSSVATVGSTNVVGAGQMFGARAVFTLPSLGSLFHSASIGLDYKDFDQSVSQSTNSYQTPIKYMPLVASYNASWQGEKYLTQFGATVTMGLRGAGSGWQAFDDKRYKATGSFITLRPDLSHMQEFGPGFQIYGRVQGQIANQPLVSSEEFSLGGQDTVRGYLESEVLGDNAVAATVELRTPNIGPFLDQNFQTAGGEAVKFNLLDELRFFAFVDAGHASLIEPLPEQQDQFDLASYGVGMRLKALRYLNGMVFLANPLITQEYTLANHPMVGFRLWGEF